SPPAVRRPGGGLRADVSDRVIDVRALDGAFLVSWRAVVAVILLIAGGSLQLLAVLGVCVMRNAYDRLHYVGLAGFGGLLMGVAVLVRESFSLIGDKALL